MGYGDQVDRIKTSMVFNIFILKENENAICMLKNKDSNDDDIKNKIMKLLLPVTFVIICSLFNQCVISGYFLEGLKLQNYAFF